MKINEEYITPLTVDYSDKAFSELYKKYYKQLKLFAVKFVYDLDCAQDIVQDVFIAMWQRKTQFDLNNQKQLEHYLFRAVKNNCLSHLRSEDNRRNHRNHILIELLNRSTEHNDHLLHSELSDKIDRIIEHLPDSTKKVFNLSRVEGLKNKQIAEKLNISEKNVEYHISRSLKIFSAKLINYLTTIYIIATFLKF